MWYKSQQLQFTETIQPLKIMPASKIIASTIAVLVVLYYLLRMMILMISRSHALNKCKLIIKEFEDPKYENSKDFQAPDKWEELMNLIQEYGFIKEDIDQTDDSMRKLKERAHNSFLAYTLYWEEQHRELKRRIMCVKMSDRVAFISEMGPLMVALENSKEQMRQFDIKLGKFA